MPMFEFNCRKCGADFEELVATSGELAPCPECGSRRVAKRISSFAVAGEARQAGGGGGCGGCSGGSCSHCHH